MANYIKCDGCNAMSPNNEGYHVANNWMKIIYSKKFDDRWPEKLILCDKCLPEHHYRKETQEAVIGFFKRLKR